MLSASVLSFAISRNLAQTQVGKFHKKMIVNKVHIDSPINRHYFETRISCQTENLQKRQKLVATTYKKIWFSGFTLQKNCRHRVMIVFLGQLVFV